MRTYTPALVFCYCTAGIWMIAWAVGPVLDQTRPTTERVAVKKTTPAPVAVARGALEVQPVHPALVTVQQPQAGEAGRSPDHLSARCEAAAVALATAVLEEACSTACLRRRYSLYHLSYSMAERVPSWEWTV